MLDILLFRDVVAGSSDILRESQRRRYCDPKTVDEVIEADSKWRALNHMSEQMKKLANFCSRTIGEKKKAKEADGEDAPLPADIAASVNDGSVDTAALKVLSVKQLSTLSKQFTSLHVEALANAKTVEDTRDTLLNHIGNVVHESVPVEVDEAKGNATLKLFGDISKKVKLNHVDIMEKLGLMDTSKAVTQMSGGRAYVLRGALVQLQLALITYSMNFLVSKGYSPFYPPFFINKDAMAEVAQLSQFDDELYKVTGEGEDKYLIATSEQPIAAYHRGKWFGASEMAEPIKYAGMSTCFRKEVGSHGKDTLGIFRVHQFDKIEQFILCSPHDNTSWKMLDEMVQTSEEFYQSLNLPYRTVAICSGALNNAAAKKIDLEAWFPSSETYRELVSCSNCTDYQSRALNCRYGESQRGKAAVNVKEHPHMLNGTLCAVTRTMCCIVENYQSEEGIAIPDVLQPFMMGQKFIPFPATTPKA